jgi:hypothetical protein
VKRPKNPALRRPPKGTALQGGARRLSRLPAEVEAQTIAPLPEEELQRIERRLGDVLPTDDARRLLLEVHRLRNVIACLLEPSEKAGFAFDAADRQMRALRRAVEGANVG